MMPPKRIEIGSFELVKALASTLVHRDRAAASRRAESQLADGEHNLAVLSVRSGLDLLLQALALPSGSEVLISAITISDMPRIVQEHGLIPVPVDLDMDSLSVCPDALCRAITSKTRAILVAHVFGSRMDLAPVAEIAREHGLLLIEDCAQAYDGTYAGSDDAGVVMFSFGPIKTQTALGGGILRVRRPDLLRRMREIHGVWPVQPAGEYRRRLLKFAVVLFALTRPVYGIVTRLLRGRHQVLLKSAVRGFPDQDFFRRIRRQPSVPLLMTLARRLGSPDWKALSQRAQQGRWLQARLPERMSPGHRADHHSYWVFPVQVPDPDEAAAPIRRLGLDPSRGTTSLTVVAPPSGRAPSSKALAAMQNVLFLPLGPGLTLERVTSLVAVLRSLPETSEPSND